MPWINLGQLLDILQGRGIDPADVLVFVTPRDIARLRHRLPVHSVSDLNESDSDNHENAEEEEQEEESEAEET